MFVLQDYSLAVAFCIVTMLCWGSWANTQKLVGSRWRFELFYWDYVFGVMLMALIFAFSMGSMGDTGRSFVQDIRQADSESIRSAIIGGIVFNAANILLVAAIAISGMAVAFPVGIGLALVVGVFVNYMADPVGNKYLLFAGVALVAVAIVVDAIAYGKLPSKKKGGTLRGLILAVLCGILMGFFYRFVAASMPDADPKNFINLPAGKVSPYTAMVLFSFGMLVSQVMFNFANVIGWATNEETPTPDYFTGTTKDHVWGVAGGMVWATGMMLSMIAFCVAGPAISYGLGQGATMIAAFWGVFIWREFREAPQGTSVLLWIMFAAYIAGLGVIVWAGMEQAPEQVSLLISGH